VTGRHRRLDTDRQRRRQNTRRKGHIVQRRPLIAIINDDPAFLEFIASFLEEETSYETVVWDDGAGSISRLRKRRPDAVILDIKLGDQAVGQEILTQMRALPDLSSIPVIVCTADTAFLRDNAESLAALNALTLEKPFDLEELEEKVATAVGRRISSTEEADPVG
jgi:DNA-binding response OmpR family regulator